MTAYRDRLAPELRGEYDAAVLRAGALLAAAYEELAEQAEREAAPEAA